MVYVKESAEVIKAGRESLHQWVFILATADNFIKEKQTLRLFISQMKSTSFLSGKHHHMKWYKSVLISVSFKLEETNALCSTVIQWLRVKFTVVSFLLIIVKIPCEIIIPKTIKTVYLYKGEDRFNNKL